MTKQPQIDSYPPETYPIKVKFLVDQVIKGLEDIKTITNNLQLHQQYISADLNNTKSEINNVYEAVADINKILKEGKGKESVLTRLALIEKSIEEMKNKLDKMDGDRQEGRKGQWQLIVALATGSMGLITAIITALLHQLG